MQLQIPETELSNYKSRDLIPLKCEQCQQIFYKPKNYIMVVLKGYDQTKQIRFCSYECQGQNKTKSLQIKCLNCNNIFIKKLSQFKKSKHHFCSKTCSAIYNNQHKTYGYNRSKIENYLEDNLKKEFPTLDIIFNDRKTLGYELDIYIPSKQLAFEINGIFHYQPIYKGYQRTIEIDQLKQKLCNEKQIQLYVFDISKIKHFKPDIGNYYLNIIRNLCV